MSYRSTSTIAFTIYLIFSLVGAVADRSSADDAAAYFSSNATGSVKLAEFGTDQPDAVNPIRPITRVHLLLESGDDGHQFIALANRHTLLESATLNDPQANFMLRLEKVRVIGFEMLPAGKNDPGRMSVELFVKRCNTVRKTR